MTISDATKHSSVGATQPTGMSVEDRLEFSDETAIKCYKCYSRKVNAICHHCGRLLCEKCQFNPFGPLHTDNVFARIRPLPNTFKQSAHCADCFHYGDTIARLVMTAILVMAAILILLPITQFAQQQTVSWTTLVPLVPWWGAGALALLLLARLTWGLYSRLPFPVKYPLGVPVFPRYTIELEEHLIADFDIAPDRYLPSRIPSYCQLTVKLGLGPEDEERYRSTPKPRPRDGKVPLHAGFVALDKPKNVRFLKKMRQHLGNNLTFLITEEIAPDEFIELCRERQAIEWVGHYRIEPEALRLGPKYDKEFPFFIKPRLLPGGRRLELRLELHEEVTRKATLDHLTLDIPSGCGVENTNGQFDPLMWRVAWREKEVTTDIPLFLHIEFKKPLGAQSQSFKGEYKLIIEDYTFSGLRVGEDPYAKGKQTETGRYMFRPASGNRVRAEGMQWMDPTVKHKTTIKGEATFETSTFLAYSIHTEPKAPDPSEEYPVSPNYKVIDAIIAALTDPRHPNQPRVYIQQIVETPGRVIETETSTNQAHCWEIKGRYYIGEAHEETKGASDDRCEWAQPPSISTAERMAAPNQAIASNPSESVNSSQPHDARIGLLQPVDIHLVILGEEPRDDHPDGGYGTLHFELVLRSIVGNGGQETTDLREHYEKLKAVIEGVIRSSGRR